ncbi:MAG: hypothetical protein EZS28_006029 [Streblomastix strix]|uniref:RING-type domain-containing protein n=1 Tax=Streblomastix strix TaxID=222440 RepID=A0A5J4WV37_9EUKA|nr:MAG: hypothetical protein EZS28_006029 [Streblomastix strix]
MIEMGFTNEQVDQALTVADGDDNIDIDSMNYDQILELEENIGKVEIVMSEEEITTLPHFTVKDNQSNVGNCAICLNDPNIGDEMLTMQCFHTYHYDCIVQWLRQSKTCPICKH